MSSKILRIGIIGAGSIGSLFGGALADIQSQDYSIKMTFFARKAHVEEINMNGLQFASNQKVRIIKNISAYETPELYMSSFDSVSFDFDFLFLCTKAYNIESAMVEYKKLVDGCKWLVVLQNGIGNEDIIKEYCSMEKILRIVTSNGALLKKPGHIIHTGIGFTKLGLYFKDSLKIKDERLEEIQENLEILRNVLDLANLETTLVEDIVKESWEKVFVNVGINPFGALTRLTNGQLLKNKGIKILMAAAVKEAVKVAEMKKVNLSEKDFIEIMYDVARKTSENKNSMLQDILKGKRTEIDFINGRIVNYAEELGINVPINETLSFLIKGLEGSSS
jgi:2-dehydropantoate 2-reductase